MKTLILTLALSVTALMVSTQTATAQAESSAIKAVIERETASFFKHDASALIDCWANVPEATQLYAYSTPEGKQVAGIDANTKTDLPQRLTARMTSMDDISKAVITRTNYNIRVSGNTAFVTFEQTNNLPDMPTQHLYETRYLEKMGGKWKLIHVGAIEFKPIN